MPKLFSPSSGAAPVTTTRHCARFNSPAPSRCCRRRLRSGRRRRRRSARRRWQRRSCGGCAPAAAKTSASICAHAAIEFRSERYLRVDGKRPDEYHDDLAGLYRCGDGRFARLHTNLPHHCSGLLKLLGVPHDKAAVQRALDRYDGRGARDRGRRSRSRRHRVPLVRRVGPPSARPSGGEAAFVQHREDRRCAAEKTRRGGSAARPA